MTKQAHNLERYGLNQDLCIGSVYLRYFKPFKTFTLCPLTQSQDKNVL